MEVSLFIVLIIALLTLLFLASRRSEVLSAPSFPFTRLCLGAAIFTYGSFLVGMQCLTFNPKGWMIFSIVAQALTWILLILVFRGIFAILSRR